MDLGKIVDRVAEKFGYSDELVSALKRCIPAMIDGKSKEDIELLKQTLERVEIHTFEKNPTKEQRDELINKKVNGRNNHVKFTENDKGEYGKVVAPASYVTMPIFDENMNIIDRASILYITNLNENVEEAKFFGTNINLDHLIHELGHAWAAQKDEYIQKENGDYINRIGTIELFNKVNKEEKIVEETEVRGLYTEEAFNSLEEEKALCKVLGISSIDQIPGHNKSVYQVHMTDFAYLLNVNLKLDMLAKLRIQNDKSVIEELNELFKKTKHFENRKTEDYCDFKEVMVKSYNAEKGMSQGAKDKLNSFFEKYKELYFGKKETPNFMEYFDGVLEGLFNFSKVRFSFFDWDNGREFPSYRNAVLALRRDGVDPISEMRKIRDREQKGFFLKLKKAVVNSLKKGIGKEEVERAEKAIGKEQDIESRNDLKDNN